MLLLVPGALRNLPQPTPAAVVIAASLSLADIGGTVRLWRQRPTEFALSITAFAGVALLGVLPGIAIAVALSIGNVFRHAWWPYQTVLGRVAGLPGYHDVRSYPDAELVPGCVLFSFRRAAVLRQHPHLPAHFYPTIEATVAAYQAEPITNVDTTADQHARRSRRYRHSRASSFREDVRRSGACDTRGRRRRSAPSLRPDLAFLKGSTHAVPFQAGQGFRAEPQG
jgi:MFS superfamily sulfate permease-like transporter